MTDLTDRLEAVFRRADGLSGGVLSILKDAIQRFGEARASQAAAGMAYYALFSLFPLLLFLVAAGSFVLDSEQAYQQAVGLVTEAVPISRELIESNFQQVLRLRGPVGIVGLIGSLWSASGFFTTLAYQINRAWPEADARHFLARRLVALGMVGSLAALLALSLVSSAALNLLPRLQVPLGGGVSVYETPLWAVLSNVVPWLLTVFLFLGLYLWVPNTPVKRSAALGGALVAAVAWEVASNAFAWYLGSRLARYQVVYGSLGAVVALMLWIYISSWIILFGAHLSAAIAQHIT
jgi:membrane protein